MKICENHEEYKVPLIYTYAWNGYEYWCPYCGDHRDMFGGVKVEETPELKKRAELYEKATEEYLNARGTLICSKTKYKGEWIKPSELPKEEIKRLQEVSKTWELNRKIEVKK